MERIRADDQNFSAEVEMGMALVGIGGLMCLVGWIWLIIHAFSSGQPVWGFLSICGLLALVYGFMHFQAAKVPTLILAGGMVLNILGGAMGGVPQG